MIVENVSAVPAGEIRGQAFGLAILRLSGHAQNLVYDPVAYVTFHTTKLLNRRLDLVEAAFLLGHHQDPERSDRWNSQSLSATARCPIAEKVTSTAVHPSLREATGRTRLSPRPKSQAAISGSTGPVASTNCSPTSSSHLRAGSSGGPCLISSATASGTIRSRVEADSRPGHPAFARRIVERRLRPNVYSSAASPFEKLFLEDPLFGDPSAPPRACSASSSSAEGRT